MKHSQKLASFSGAVIINSKIFDDLTPSFNVNIVFIIILSAFVVFSLNCEANTNN